MNIQISNNLKRLRKQREITQEELANFIGVSFQAISKWERNEGYPDITILPTIANFFGVTLDELVGMNEIKNEEKLTQIKETVRYNYSNSKIDDNISLLREALKTFPNNYKLLSELACCLEICETTLEEHKKNIKESIEISERILEFCTDTKIRNDVQANICFTYWRNGNTEKAIKLAEKLPSIYKTRENTLIKFLSSDKKVEEIQKNIQKLVWSFWNQIKNLIQTDIYSNNEKILLLEKSIQIYKIVYEKEDFTFAHIRLADSFEEIAKLYLVDGKVNEALVYLEKAIEHAIIYDTQPDKINYKSLLVNTLVYDKLSKTQFGEHNISYYLCKSIQDDDIYTKNLENEGIKKIIKKLKEYAK